MLKSYLEYAELKSCGVVTSFPSNILFDNTGKFAITGALERVNLWNIRQGVLITSLVNESNSKKKNPTVSIIRLSPDNVHLAIGYADGSISIWNLTTREKETRFDGHKSEISALNFNSDGTFLVSGSKDTDLIIWDVLAERGLYKLRGHKNIITEAVFLDKTRALVSSSKDQLVKIWDLETRHCLQTIVGHPGEVLSLAVNKEETRVITVCADGELRVYKLLELEEIKSNVGLVSDHQVNTEEIDVVKMETQDPFRRAEYWGVLKRKTTETPIRIQFSKDNSLIGVQSSAKVIEFFNVHNLEEIKKKQTRSAKRHREKQRKQVEGTDEAITEYVSKPTDEYSSKQVLRTTHKILSFDFIHEARSKNVIVSLYNNTIELYKRKSKTVTVECSIALQGHRSDIRSIAFSSHDEMVMSTSNNDLKIWNVNTANCIRTIPSGYGLCGFFVPGDKHVVIGTKEGEIQLYDLNSASCLEVNNEIHNQSIFSLILNPAKTGFISASTDKKVAFWDFELISTDTGNGINKVLHLEHKKTIDMPDGIFAAKFSPDGRYLAVALMDFTIRIYFADTHNFYLSLYGHKLPVMCLDISSDSTLVVSGSADKNVRIWGIDFGDCHRSLFAHDDTVTQVAFVPDTHYFFTSGKDGVIKYWDADKFEHIMSLEGHHSEIWAMSLSREGNFLVSAGHDRSLRFWRQTDTQLFLEEQRELEVEEGWEKNLEREIGVAQNDAETQPAIKHSIENIKDAERIMEAIDLVEEERLIMENYEKELQNAKDTLGPKVVKETEEKGRVIVQKPTQSVLLMDMEPSDYLRWVISKINIPDLESALMVLPFSHVLSLFYYLEEWTKKGQKIFLCSTIIFFLLRIFQVQISANRALQEKLTSLSLHCRANLQKSKDTLDFNVTVMDLLKKQITDKDGADFFEISSKLADLNRPKKNSNVRKWWEDSETDDEEEGEDAYSAISIDEDE